MLRSWRFQAKQLTRALIGDRIYEHLKLLLPTKRRRLERAVYRAAANTVMSGPFAGMRLHGIANPAYFPQVLGTYEQELHPVIAHIAKQPFAHIINIGADEGFYAVGLARLLPNARVTAFEMHVRGQKHIQRNAQLNGVADRISVGGLCGAEDLASSLTDAGHALIVCDVEGAEIELLDPARIPALSEAAILVEIHDNKKRGRGASTIIRERFAATHAITVIPQMERAADDFRLSGLEHMQIPLH